MSPRLVASCFLIASTFPALAQDEIPINKLTDNELTCRQIVDEVKQMEQIAASAKGEQEKARKAQEEVVKAQQEAMQSSMNRAAVLSFVPFLGFLGAGASIAASVGTTAAGAAELAGGPGGVGPTAETARKAMNATTRMAQASARKSYLTQLFTNKGCKLSEVEGNQAEAQGRDQPPRVEQAPAPSVKPAEIQEAPGSSNTEAYPAQ